MSSSLKEPLIVPRVDEVAKVDGAFRVDAVSIFGVPARDSKLRHPMTGLVNGMVRRSSKSNKDRFIFCLQTGKVDGKDRTKRKPMLLAQRQTTVLYNKFYIFDISKSSIDPHDELLSSEAFKSKDDPRFVGKLQRVFRNNPSHICYSLFQGRHEEEFQVATVMYEIPSTVAHLKKETFRVANIALFSEMPAKNNEEAVLDNTALEEAVNSFLSKKKALGQIIAPAEGIYVSSTKLPVADKDGVFKVKFGNRGKGTSMKNMLLTDHLHKDVSNLQMVAFDKDALVDFAVDFVAPFNAFQAFGFAICQFDL